MNKHLLLFLTVFGFYFTLSGQSFEAPRFYIGAEVFNRKLFFNDEGYYGMTLGSEVFRYKFIAPEVEIGFYGGKLDKHEEIDTSGLPDGYAGVAPDPIGFTTDGFNAFTYNFTPKIIFGDEDFAFVLLPKYTFAKINSYASYYGLDEQAMTYNREEREEQESSQSFLSLGFGIEGYVFDTEKLALAFTFQYSFFSTREAFEDIQVRGLRHDQGTKALGLGLRLYYDPFNKY